MGLNKVITVAPFLVPRTVPVHSVRGAKKSEFAMLGDWGGMDAPFSVFWVACGTHLNKDIFDNPTTFDPSRFEHPLKPIPPYAYVPFGAGTRMCIGTEFGRIETLVVIHHLVIKFEWSLVDPNEAIKCQPFPYPSLNLPINLKPILPSSKI
ncbi:hypothetical protein IFM89_022220 [Coptis chinensis]|uniref:Cytochrome P450 n=1 Tax=Coptis chinensis TaxID=261450 RepID=A0A835M622_9MAGN|nr:hypothetical protein IFM89_022220 [Coptis chinensis]